MDRPSGLSETTSSWQTSPSPPITSTLQQPMYCSSAELLVDSTHPSRLHSYQNPTRPSTKHSFHTTKRIISFIPATLFLGNPGMSCNMPHQINNNHPPFRCCNAGHLQYSFSLVPPRYIVNRQPRSHKSKLPVWKRQGRCEIRCIQVDSPKNIECFCIRICLLRGIA